MRNFLLNFSRTQIIGNSDNTIIKDMADNIAAKVVSILGPIMTVIGVAAVCYAIYLGVLYAKAEDADKRKQVQGRLIGSCIGAVIIIAGATLCFALPWSTIFQGYAFSK